MPGAATLRRLNPIAFGILTVRSFETDEFTHDILLVNYADIGDQSDFKQIGRFNRVRRIHLPSAPR